MTFARPAFKRRMFYASVFCFLLQSTLNAQLPKVESKLVELTDMLRIQQPGSLQLAEDGNTLVFTVTSSMPDPKNKWEYPYQTQLWTATADGSVKPRQLTFANESSTQPALTADGKKLAFVRTVNNVPQLFVMHLQQGGEARQFTDLPWGVAQPQWSADGSQLYFAMNTTVQNWYADSVWNTNAGVPLWPWQKPGFSSGDVLVRNDSTPNPNGNLKQVRAWLALNEKDGKAKVINKLNFQQEANTSSALQITQLYSIPAEPMQTPVPVTRGFYNYQSLQTLPNKSFAVLRQADDAAHPDEGLLHTALFQIDANGKMKSMWALPGDSTISSVSISPNGKWIASTISKSSFAQVPAIVITSTEMPGKTRTIIPLDRGINNMQWSKDENRLYFTSQTNGGIQLMAWDVNSKKLSTLTNAAAGISSFAVQGNNVVYVKTEVRNPFEVYSFNHNTNSERQLTTLNEGWVSKKQLSLPVKKTFTNDVGLEVEYWVMKPANFKEGQKFPVILEIHGGPTAMWGPGESSMWHEFQYYAAKGYGVVYANPRGSGGYGAKFLQANVGNWGDGPMSDVLKALDLSLQENSWMDKSNLAVTGGSYAGYLIAYMLGHDQRFKAACAQRGVYDLTTFFGEGNAWRLVPNYFGGYPWQKDVKELLERESPINYVENIRTPLIIFHGENDLRTGVIQSEQLYRSLKVLGRTVEYVRHPGATHEITRSGNNRQRMDQMLRTWEFFERFIQH